MDLNQQNQESVPPKKYSSIIKWSLIVGIVIVVNLFINYAISLVYEAPQYSDFCKDAQVIDKVTTQSDCLAKGGQWDENYYDRTTPPATPEERIGYCNLQYTCGNDYEDVRVVYERNIFVILVVLGIALVAGSFALAFNWILSVSASMAGILSVIIASIRYWSEADNWLRVLILFIALCSLIYFAVRKFKD